MTARPRHGRSRRFRIVRALLLGVAALAFAYTWDGSRQPASGSGWQLLAAQRGLGTIDTVAVIADSPALALAWDQLRLIPAVPSVDFTRTVVVRFVDSGTFACRSRLDGVAFDRDAGTVTANFGRGLVLFCDDDANVPDSFLVALDRDRLPPAPYRLVLAGRRPPGVAPPALVIDE